MGEIFSPPLNSLLNTNMNNIVINYLGGSGGSFVYYYLLASDSNIFSNVNSIKIGEHKNFLDKCFYDQFRKDRDLNDWKKTEICPSTDILPCDNGRQMFLFCNEVPKNFNVADSVIINPYIGDKKKWLRIQVLKRCWEFATFPKKYTYKDFLKRYQRVHRKLEQDSKVANADFYLDFLKFLYDKNERIKLCDFLKISVNSRMEQYLTHYLDCHGDFLSRLTR